MLKIHLFFFLVLLGTSMLHGQVSYPYPLKQFHLQVENQPVRMAYMDERPTNANGKTILLLHGKNFNGYYWKNVIPALVTQGYRVLVPDQVGWGRSDKPLVHYSFHLLAANNKTLLDSLGIKKVTVVGHSMGGMLATRFSLMYPNHVEKLVLENPIGLEDYRTFVPYQPLNKLLEKEKAATYESYKKYQQSYYPKWDSSYEQYVQAQAEVLNDSNFQQIAFVNAVTYQMIYEQPVLYEVGLVKIPTLLIIGQEDRTVVGKDQLTDEQKKKYGQYPSLGKKLKKAMPGSKLVELPGTGHIPHIQNPGIFISTLLNFL